MRLTEKQKNDLETIEYFIPSHCDWEKRNEKSIKMFFEYSDQGKHKDIASIHAYLPEGRTYFHALVWGKKRRGIHIHELWEPAILEGTITYYELVQDLPISVVKFMQKEIFRGTDSELIGNLLL